MASNQESEPIVSYDNSPAIKCRFNGRETVAVFCTGSEYSHIEKQMAKDFDVFHLLNSDEKWIKVFTGLGQSTKKSIGRIHLIGIELIEPNADISFPFMVVKDLYMPSVVLGLNFMAHFGCVIEFGSNTIYFGRIGVQIGFTSLNQILNHL